MHILTHSARLKDDLDTVLFPVNYVLHAYLEPKNDYEPVFSLTRKETTARIFRNEPFLKGLSLSLVRVTQLDNQEV
jgi:hypothetical protein